MSANIEHVYALQATLFGWDEPHLDAPLSGIERLALDAWSWVDHRPGWLHGSDVVFESLRDQLSWSQRRVVMYDRVVDEPRLTWWRRTEQADADPVPVLAEARAALDAHYGRTFDSVGLNYYRHGQDSVAWHGDRNRLWSHDPIIAILSVGEPRPFLLRPRGGGASRRYELGSGDLLVMGGACQDRWEHAVPKVAHAGPRISITYRHQADEPPAGVGYARLGA